ncbi:type VI secretion system baseplate subunit TssG [Geofilum rubicundum]|uniref:Uncharacterized protein n=1 Tax=Geofilum rubicundum JCM 15548 TaxID=1236989 RepID=A0A0E9M102_9BACT|nr:type VI secretion system baseplate subunit TssG [Geofilum rubicundum]GAO31051.1 hypothetical protein JCM15548_13386 [Geofilum rubicundum JCM 15548]
MKLKNDTNHRQHINTCETDYKAEVIAGLMVELGHSADKLLIVRKGAGKRGVSKDIAEVHHGRYKNTNTSFVLHTNRKSLYDHLPEGLFHQSSHAHGERSKESVLADMNRHRADEFFIRDFFRLFETETDIVRILTQTREFQYDKKNSHHLYINIYDSFWPILKQMELSKAVLFMKMIPLVSKIRLSKIEVAQALSLILDVPVQISSDTPTKMATFPLSLPNLGEARLGRNLIAKGDHRKATRTLKVRVGPIATKNMEGFMVGHHSHNVLELILDNLLPANKERLIQLVSSPEASHFSLMADKAERKVFLGINTWLHTTPKTRIHAS